jgi:tRNA-splicing ligase RtcB (3'-phosphate/5'-hydroxy nucleic acid ligase)
MKIKKISDYEWEISDSKIPINLFVNEKILEQIKKDDTLKQATNMAKLPGVLKVAVMPDAHQGYGACIGGVAGFDLEKGVISPGMVGFDINCGVRLLSTNISKKEFLSKRKEITHDIKRTIPSGLGRGGERYSKEIIKEVLEKGSEWALENKLATKKDLEKTEENGRMENADSKDVSDQAIARGLPQLGTLGAGNHFIDIQEVEEIYDEKTAKKFKLEKNKIAIMIHCGSRGLGHQVASDYIREIEEKYSAKKFPDRELGYAPIDSEIGKKYFSAMKCAVNFAFCNRQIIMHKIREILKKNFPNKKIDLVYDLAHNIAKIEEHKIPNKKKILVVRKGATRAFENQPVIIPGSMSTPSFVLVGTKNAEKISLASSAHGAGRAHSRTWAHKTLDEKQIKKILDKKDILLEGSPKATIEESEMSYKDIEEVIDVTEKAGISKKVAKLKPLAVVIG